MHINREFEDKINLYSLIAREFARRRIMGAFTERPYPQVVRAVGQPHAAYSFIITDSCRVGRPESIKNILPRINHVEIIV